MKFWRKQQFQKAAHSLGLQSQMPQKWENCQWSSTHFVKALPFLEGCSFRELNTFKYVCTSNPSTFFLAHGAEALAYYELLHSGNGSLWQYIFLNWYCDYA